VPLVLEVIDSQMPRLVSPPKVPRPLCHCQVHSFRMSSGRCFSRLLPDDLLQVHFQSKLAETHDGSPSETGSSKHGRENPDRYRNNRNGLDRFRLRHSWVT
jgi:hypothetical protein